MDHTYWAPFISTYMAHAYCASFISTYGPRAYRAPVIIMTPYRLEYLIFLLSSNFVTLMKTSSDRAKWNIMTSTSSVNYKESYFEHPVLTDIRGGPTYETLNHLKNELKVNASSVQPPWEAAIMATYVWSSHPKNIAASRLLIHSLNHLIRASLSQIRPEWPSKSRAQKTRII